jgi:ribonuclease I
VRRYPHGYLSDRWAAHTSDRCGIWSPPAGFAPAKAHCGIRRSSNPRVHGLWPHGNSLTPIHSCQKSGPCRFAHELVVSRHSSRLSDSATVGRLSRSPSVSIRSASGSRPGYLIQFAP